MSCYLNIYLVPKEQEGVKATPLYLTQYSRSSEVYRLIDEHMSIPFWSSEEEMPKAQLELRDIEEIEAEVDECIKKDKERLNTLYKILEKGYNEDLKTEIIDLEAYIREQEEIKIPLAALKIIVEESYNEWSDFGSVVINQS